MPDWKALETKPDNSGHQSSIHFKPNGMAPDGAGQCLISVTLGGKCPAMPDLIASLSGVVAKRTAERLQSEAIKTLQEEVGKLERNQATSEKAVTEAQTTLANVATARNAPGLLTSPDYVAIDAGLNRDRVTAQEIVTSHGAALERYKARLVQLRQVLRQEREAVSKAVVEEMRAEFQEEKAKAEELFLKTLGKSLDRIAEAAAKMQAVGHPGVLERAAVVAGAGKEKAA